MLKVIIEKNISNIIEGKTIIISKEIYAGLTSIVDLAHFFFNEIVHLEGK